METRKSREWALACVGVYTRALEWIVGLAATPEEKREEAEGFLLTGRDAEVLGIPLREIYVRIADRMRVDPDPHFTTRNLTFWKGFRRFAIRSPDGRIQQGYPGEWPMEGTVEQVESMPRPMCLPFCDIICALERAAAAFGLEPRALHFHWKKSPIHSGETLFQALTIGGANPRRVLAALERWREEVETHINGEQGIPAQVLAAPPMPRSRVLELLKYQRRTVQRWDRQGFADKNLPWSKGWLGPNGITLYDLKEIWTVLSTLLARKHGQQYVSDLVNSLASEHQAYREEAFSDPSAAY